jgi:hypothetical protein
MSTNRDRAERAARVVTSMPYWGQNEPETDLGDFLCDLQHACRLNGWDWDEALEKADFHQLEESKLGWDEEE